MSVQNNQQPGQEPDPLHRVHTCDLLELLGPGGGPGDWDGPPDGSKDRRLRWTGGSPGGKSYPLGPSLLQGWAASLIDAKQSEFQNHAGILSLTEKKSTLEIVGRQFIVSLKKTRGIVIAIHMVGFFISWPLTHLTPTKKKQHTICKKNQFS